MKGRTGRFLLVGLIIVFLLVASRIIGFYVDLLFFEEVGYEKVFLKVFSTEVFTGLIFGAVSFLFVLVNALLVSVQQPARCSAELGRTQQGIETVRYPARGSYRHLRRYVGKQHLETGPRSSQQPGHGYERSDIEQRCGLLPF
jgi:uncharacterized membrane protein (UPF0182 family)